MPYILQDAVYLIVALVGFFWMVKPTRDMFLPGLLSLDERWLASRDADCAASRVEVQPNSSDLVRARGFGLVLCATGVSALLVRLPFAIALSEIAVVLYGFVVADALSRRGRTSAPHAKTQSVGQGVESVIAVLAVSAVVAHALVLSLQPDHQARILAIALWLSIPAGIIVYWALPSAAESRLASALATRRRCGSLFIILMTANTSVLAFATLALDQHETLSLVLKGCWIVATGLAIWYLRSVYKSFNRSLRATHE